MGKKQVHIPLVAEHFLGNYYDPKSCPLARATQAHFGTNLVSVYPKHAIIKGKRVAIKDGFSSWNCASVKSVMNVHPDTKFHVTLEMSKWQYFLIKYFK